MSPQDRTFDFSEPGDTKGVPYLTYSEADQLASTQAVQLHITVEKTVQYDTDDGGSGQPEDLPTSESKYSEV